MTERTINFPQEVDAWIQDHAAASGRNFDNEVSDMIVNLAKIYNLAVPDGSVSLDNFYACIEVVIARSLNS